jgi:rare lipoprotein A
MNDGQGRRALKFGAVVSSLAVVVVMSACSSSPQPKSMVLKRTATQSKEYFPEAKYGKASPRMTSQRSRLPRGGGRDQVGKPYKVAGKWYYPKEQPGYSKKGKASWYGDAFHGRLTANGEIYDMTHLSAAHPTMPLPSYARVTNLKNGTSVMVRVNDRGPFAHGRVIDLSKRAAEMLDYTHSGIADVRVDYVGRAPLEGRDDEYLLASYKPGAGAPDPSDGLATGVMIAMAGPTPTVSIGGGQVAAASAFPGQLTTSVAPDGAPSAIEFPEYGPVIADRPLARLGKDGHVEALGYADSRIAEATSPFARMAAGGLAPAEIIRSWTDKRTPDSAYVAVGSFAGKAEADRVSDALAPFGRIEVERTVEDGAEWYSVSLRPDGQSSLDDLLEQAWASGANDAFVVRE